MSGAITRTQNQVGEAARVVGWVAEGYQEILRDQRFGYNFVKEELEAPLVPGQFTYTGAELGAPRLIEWDTYTARVGPMGNLNGEQFLNRMLYPDFRNRWRFGSNRNVQSIPLDVSVDDRVRLVLGPIPDFAHTLIIEYTASAPPLILEEDVPLIPERFQSIIMWIALRHYGLYEAAPEVVARADLNYNKVLSSMLLDQGDEITVGAPLC